MTLAEIKARGTRLSNFDMNWVSNIIRCADGFKLSVIAGAGTYCVPRPEPTLDWPEESGPYTHAEVGFPSARPEPWSEWEQYCANSDEPTRTVYGFVPFEMIEALVELHGGEAMSARG